MKQIPVILVEGFLESGKSTYINYVLKAIGANKKVLLIQCEEGEVEYEAGENVAIEMVEYSEDFIKPELKLLEEKHQPDYIIIEANGMWQLQVISLGMPNNWKQSEMITIINAETYTDYQKNITSLMNEKLRNANKIIFNRVTDETAKALRERNLRLVNPTKEIYLYFKDRYELYDNGTLRLEKFNKDSIYVDDSEFGFWFADYSHDRSFYLGKTVTISGSVIKYPNAKKNQFVIGRSAMVCCENDMTFLAILVESDKAVEAGYYEVSGTFIENDNPQIPYILKATSVTEKEVPKDFIVRF